MLVSRYGTWLWLIAALLTAPGIPACQSTGEAGGSLERPTALGEGSRVLMIGNSLTSANNLAGMLEALADSAGLRWEVEAITAGGGSLEDHWQLTTTRDRIRTGEWNAVVLQQGPSSLPESRAHLREWTATFDAEIRAGGAWTALYEVWPERARLDVFDRVRDSYALAAVDVGGRFLPAGEAWRAAWREDPSAPLYGLDGFHPSEAGTYAAALAIFAGLTDRSPLGLPDTLRLPDGGLMVGVPPALAAALQTAAAEAAAGYRDYVPEDRP